VTRGRPIRGFFGGLFLGLCLDLDLVFTGAVRLDSNALVILPIVLIVLCTALGIWAPIGRARLPAVAPLPSALPRPVAWPDNAPLEGSTPPPAPPPPPRDPPPTSSI